MSSISEHPVISGVAASILAAGVFAGWDYLKSIKDPEDIANAHFIEIKRRVTSAESLLRSVCVADRDALNSAYKFLIAPDSNSTFRMHEFLRPDEELKGQNIFTLSHNLLRMKKRDSWFPLSMSPESFVKMRHFSKSIVDNFDSSAAISPSNSPSEITRLRKVMRKLLVEGYSDMFFSNKFSKEFYQARVDAGTMEPVEAEILSDSQSFDTTNEGYWWSACNKRVGFCFRLTGGEFERIGPSVEGKNIRDHIVANLTMFRMFKFFLEERKVPMGISGVQAQENVDELEHVKTYRSKIGECKELFLSLYPVGNDLLDRRGFNG